MNEPKDRIRGCARAVGRHAGLLVAVVVGLGVGALLHAAFSPAGGSAPVDRPGAGADEPGTYWTCSMHPEVRRPGPGRCPKCPMALYAVRPTRPPAGGPREFATSEVALALMDVEVAPVERRFVQAEIRLAGKIDYDETKLAYITAWVGGRLDRLFVNYTGVPVRKGDHLADVYSPELLGAQEELLQALQAVKTLAASEVAIIRETAKATVTAVREKLRLLGLKAEQIDRIEKTAKVTDHLTIYSPASGIVVHKNAQEGMYVKTGTRIYTIADLSQVWVQLDAYESDLEWIAPGQDVTFTTGAYPGETFTGRVSFVHPVLHETTRTVKVRITMANRDGRLKPGMFVKAIVRATLPAGGRVLSDHLAGKWICPHHPDVVENAAGKCSKCGWALRRAEELYNVVDPAKAVKPLIVPASAPLVTGTRAIVYVKIDPSLLRPASVTDWPRLLQEARATIAAPDANQTGFLNVVCPIMGTKLDLANVPANLTRPYKGGKVAFCCAGCPEKWDKLPEAARQAKLKAASAASGPVGVLWQGLTRDLREALLATGPGKQPEAGLQDRFCREVNAMFHRPGLAGSAAWQAVRLGAEGQSLRRLAAADLTPTKRTRLHRLLLEAVLPKAIARAAAGPTFEGREIVLGPRAGDYYLVRSGLAEGESVVVRGNFKIDSALQLQAKPSMMSPEPSSRPGTRP